MQKLFKSRNPSTEGFAKERNNSIDSAAPLQFSTMDFFDRFVRPASEKGLLRTPLPTPITKQHVRQCSIQLLQAARLSPEEVRVVDDNYGGTIAVSKHGLSQVMAYLQYRQQTKAAIVIQKTFRGFVTRKVLAAHFLSIQLNRNSFVNPEDHIAYLEVYISQISSLYHTILTASRSTSTVSSPSKDEMEFMKKLNSQETYKVCLEYLHMIAEKELKPQLSKQRMTILPGGTDLQNTMVMYQEYAPKVTVWISKVLGIQFHPTQDLLFILRSGDIFCRLACALYKKVDCHLLGKGLEYGIHKIIFFLELCKSLHIKRSLLFQVSDLLVWPENDLNRKHALIVLRTVIALEKHARKSGWDGPSMDLKPVAKDSLGVSSRDTMMLVNNSSISSEFAPPVPSNSNLFPPVPSKVQEQKTQSLFNTGVDSISSRASLASKPSREFQAQPANDPPEPVSKQSRFKLEPPPDIEPKNTSRFKLEPAIDLGSDSFSQPAHFEGNTYTTEFMPQSSSLDPLPPSELESMPPVLPPIEQHEAYHFQDSSDEENSDVMGSSAASHSKNMMAALTFNELVEEDINGSSPELIQGDQSTPKLRESSPPESSPGNGTFQENMRKKILAEAIEERLIMREKAVNDFIQEEQTYVTNLSNVVDYLNKIIKQRKRKSANMPELTEGERRSLKTPHNLKLSGIWSHAPLPNESERAYKFRLETEIEELHRLFTVVEEMLSLHVQFLDRLKSCWNETYGCMIIGEAISQFASSIQNSYTTYAVVTLSGVQKSHLTLNSRGDFEKSEFVNRIVNRYVVSNLESEDVEEPSEQDWQWYLKRPIHRLSTYSKFLAAIHGDNKIKLNPVVDADNKKLRICSIKLDCISEAIGDHLDPKNK